MTASQTVDLMRELFVTTFWLSLPILGVAFLIGIVVSLAQIVTSIQDASFAAVPRLTAFLVTLLVALPWMLTKLVTYTAGLLGNLSRFAH